MIYIIIFICICLNIYFNIYCFKQVNCIEDELILVKATTLIKIYNDKIYFKKLKKDINKMMSNI